MSNYENNETENFLDEELTDAELENVQGGYIPFFPVVENNQYLQQISAYNFGDTNQVGIQYIG